MRAREGHAGWPTRSRPRDLRRAARQLRWWIPGLLAIVLLGHLVHLPILIGRDGPGPVSAVASHPQEGHHPAAAPHPQEGHRPTAGPAGAAAETAGALDVAVPGTLPRERAQPDAATAAEPCLFEAIGAAGRSLPPPIFAAVAGLIVPPILVALRRAITLAGPVAASGRRRRAWLQVYLN